MLKVGSTFYMLYTKDYCTTSHIDLAESTDGITFNDVEAIVPAQAGYRNQNPNLFLTQTMVSIICTGTAATIRTASPFTRERRLRLKD